MAAVAGRAAADEKKGDMSYPQVEPRVPWAQSGCWRYPWVSRSRVSWRCSRASTRSCRHRQRPASTASTISSTRQPNSTFLKTRFAFSDSNDDAPSRWLSSSAPTPNAAAMMAAYPKVRVQPVIAQGFQNYRGGVVPISTH
uniref:Uncharacterized protein n=1 Tax=Rhodococcus hoagii TaxID=43767 RepID=A0A1Z1UYQ9_RHOHA|nr:hypothetical protein pVAPN1572_0913 [Prescottella equi]